MDPKQIESERQLVEELQALQPKLYRFARRLMGSSAEAEDVVQEAFIRIWNNRKKVDGIENLESWCMTITKNIAFDEIKKRKRHRTIDLDQAYQASSNEPAIDRKIHLQQVVQRVKAALDRLPVAQQMAVHLRDIEGYSYKEIVDMTDMTLDQVKINIHRGRQKLRLVMQSTVQNTA